MNEVPHPANEIELRLLEAAVTEAKKDPRPAVPHEIVRARMLAEISRLKRKADQR
jgi:hypothetical protein